MLCGLDSSQGWHSSGILVPAALAYGASCPASPPGTHLCMPGAGLGPASITAVSSTCLFPFQGHFQTGSLRSRVPADHMQEYAENNQGEDALRCWGGTACSWAGVISDAIRSLHATLLCSVHVGTCFIS